jgi:hypothetical protein
MVKYSILTYEEDYYTRYEEHDYDLHLSFNPFNNLVHFWCNSGGGGGQQVLGEDFGIGAFKGMRTTELFVDDDTERVLIAGRACLGLDLFWSHVGDCADGYLRAHG